MKGKFVSQSTIERYEQVFPQDLNPLDRICGERIMALLDRVGSLAAQKHSGHVCVTAAVDSIDFLSQVKKGEILLLKASVNRVWNTSCEVGIRVMVCNFQDNTSRHVASAYLVFVALDENGKNIQMPPIIPRTKNEKRRFEEAEPRRQIRLARKKRS